MSNRLVIGTLAIFISAAPTWAEDECPKGTGSGVWAANTTFTRLRSPLRAPGFTPAPRADHHELCRVSPSLPLPPKQTIVGVCSAGGGPADSCNECLTTPPSDPCEWHWEHI
jgi:hypothetical protein